MTATAPLLTVLGASGFLGTAVARLLAARPVRLRLVGRRPTRVPSDARADIDIRCADLTAPGALHDAVEGSDAIVHLIAHLGGRGTWRVAADDPVAERVNCGLMYELLDLVRPGSQGRPPTVVFAGSMSQVGHSHSDTIDGTEPDRPLTAYDRQKLAAEQALEEATSTSRVRGVTLRLATLYGCGVDPVDLDRGVVATMTRRAFGGEPLTMWHDGSVRRDLLCVDDAARAFVAALDRTEALEGRHWLVGTGQGTTVRALFTAIADAVASQTGRPPVPVVRVTPTTQSMPTDLLDFVVDPERFQHASGWSPRVALADGLASYTEAVLHGTGARLPTPAAGS